MHTLDPGFAVDDERAALFRTVVSLVEEGATREQIKDAAVWATVLFERDYLRLVADFDLDGAVNLLLIAAHDGFACECCGFHAIELPVARGSGQVCSVCGWNDSDPVMFDNGGWNKLDLDSAQAHFLEHGVQSHLVDAVTSPTSRQAKRRPLQTLETRRQLLLKTLEPTFSLVTLGGGYTLEDARASDEYDEPRPEFEYQRTEPWSDVNDERLDSFPEWIFLDDRGAFFYLIPAMRFMLSNRTPLGPMGNPMALLLRYRDPKPGRWLFEYANTNQLGFIGEFFDLVSDAWLDHSPRWNLGLYGDDRSLMTDAAEAIATYLTSR